MHKDLSPGINYCKLTQFDKDGKAEELGIKAVYVFLTAHVNYAYLNPLSSNVLKIKYKSAENGVPVPISIYRQDIYNQKAELSGGLIEIQLTGKPSS